MLKYRVLTSVIGIPIMLGCLFYSGIYLQALVFLIVLVGLLEFARLAGSDVCLDYLLLAGLSFLFVTYSGINSATLLSWLIVQMFYYMIRSMQLGNRLVALSPNLLGVFYVAVPYSFLWLVREQFGFLWIVYALIVTWVTDSTAYFGGTKFGKHKLAPDISPKKSVEGAILGCVGGLLAGTAYGVFFLEQSIALSAGLSIVLSIAGQVGDLTESALKRERAVKDSGSLLPGHGGILDRFDSLAFVLPLLFIALSLIISPGL